MLNQFLIKPALICIVSILGMATVNAQKVANYAIGKYGATNYEHFSFWTKAGKRAEITYTYGKDGKELPVKYLGKASYEGKAAFKIQLPNGSLLYVITSGINLKVQNTTKSYNKLFTWAYEGPVNGMGTFCEACAEDEKEAMKLLNSAYMK
ncbi:hypothetical protein MUGA111182_12740 [Mucilaginibacter galii]|uniref:DUF4468 domain-containing protein n=1 Tax=Mucilaginibacter galii TaxID=2005073 RepID=A0A917JC94_9SPHI|nr:hypothetical protein [Mucilaginibacter galii]GGI51917.1 hypothetical protein GCM10011425_31290 [Mucilaginibacter galii]